MDAEHPLLTSPSSEAFRAARAALRRAVPNALVTDDPLQTIPGIVEEIQDLAEKLLDVAAAEVGPTINWKSSPGSSSLEAVELQVDFDHCVNDIPADIELFDLDEWRSSPLARAARAYRRECHLDFSPDEAGIWLMSVEPYFSIGGSESTLWNGALNGFAVLYDRDGDGEYESLGHLWTASAWRSRGIGKRLVQLALNRFPIRMAEGPITADGARVLNAVAPELMRPR